MTEKQIKTQEKHFFVSESNSLKYLNELLNRLIVIRFDNIFNVGS